MATVYIALGSNMGDRKMNIHKALRKFAECSMARVKKVSSLIETKPEGFLDQSDFINAVAEIETELPPEGLLAAALDVESWMGRKRTIHWGPRVIDIDILLYGEISIDKPGLTIPHPAMMRRRFVLEPLAEIAPDLVLPGGVTAREAAERLAGAQEGPSR
ncbi:MAG: 2-amino-4-hydroxy-6-hydroxymethyldihydropteridine diphosphokinase [Armatimonadota bacterium]|nr:2-amino-4-hydroxy-6-hydroxymethyldihydropteridine diphosphokinase [Armatimonadota bacterium]